MYYDVRDILKRKAPNTSYELAPSEQLRSIMSYTQRHIEYTNWYEEKYPRPPLGDKSHPFGAKKLPETKTRERIEAQYTSRTNTCPVCFTQRASISGKCLCE
jgi:hypothetical protein